MCRASAEKRANAMVAEVVKSFTAASASLGLSLQQRADILGVSRQSLYRWETDPAECTKFAAVTVLISATEFLEKVPENTRALYRKGGNSKARRDELVGRYTAHEEKTPV